MGGYELMSQYTFSKDHLDDVMSHIFVYGIEVVSLYLSGDLYIIELSDSVPSVEEYLHLNLHYNFQEIA